MDYHWIADPEHTQLKFKVRHMLVANVTGEFKVFDLQVKTKDLDFKTAEVELKVEAASVDTSNINRDDHLRSTDFFDVARYPYITFRSLAIQAKDEENYILKGELTIREITKTLYIPVELGGVITDAEGNLRAGFSLQTSINRFDFNLHWNMLLETGGAIVERNIHIEADVQLVCYQN